MPIDLIIQLVSGAVGGNLAGAALKNINMGWLMNSVLGIIGGGATGQLLGPIINPMLGMAGTAATSGMDPIAILNSVLQGGVGGGVLMALAGVLKGLVAGK